jgi:hypothetical protein
MTEGDAFFCEQVSKKWFILLNNSKMIKRTKINGSLDDDEFLYDAACLGIKIL